VVSTAAMLILDQRTMQIKYRVPATDIHQISLSPFFDDIAVVHVKVVSTIYIHRRAISESHLINNICVVFYFRQAQRLKQR
jgi:hypothetical protein